MNIYLYICVWLFILIAVFCIAMYFFHARIARLEKELIKKFISRSDIFPWLYEVSRTSLTRHHEVFDEILTLRKKEFSLVSMTNNIESFIELQWHIHHEINFIFQICNKNPSLLKDKKFLYLRDIAIQKSSKISKDMKKYRRIIEIYNSIIRYKNYTLIWFLIPFTKKAAL